MRSMRVGKWPSTSWDIASGIATRTSQIVKKAKAVNPSVVVVTTRKAFPGTKKVAIKAIIAGGALPHRLGLSETILVLLNNTRPSWVGWTLSSRPLGICRHRRPRKKLWSKLRLGMRPCVSPEPVFP